MQIFRGLLHPFVIMTCSIEYAHWIIQRNKSCIFSKIKGIFNLELKHRHKEFFHIFACVSLLNRPLSPLILHLIVCSDTVLLFLTLSKVEIKWRKLFSIIYSSIFNRVLCFYPLVTEHFCDKFITDCVFNVFLKTN